MCHLCKKTKVIQSVWLHFYSNKGCNNQQIENGNPNIKSSILSKVTEIALLKGWIMSFQTINTFSIKTQDFNTRILKWISRNTFVQH